MDNNESKFVQGLIQLDQGKPILGTGITLSTARNQEQLRQEAEQHTQQVRDEVFFPASVSAPLPPQVNKSKKQQKTQDYKPTSKSAFGAGFDVEKQNVTNEEIEEMKRMKKRELLFVRSSSEGETWKTVLVYDDGIEYETRIFEEDELTGAVEMSVKRLPKGQRLIYNNPVIPEQVVMVHNSNTPSDPEKDKSSKRKIRWKGMPSNSGGEWQYATISVDFNGDEVKDQEASSWFPTSSTKWNSTYLEVFKLMILNDPNRLWRNPNEYGGNSSQKFEDLPQLPITHTFAVTGWCSPNKLAAIAEGGSEDDLAWEHITPSHQMYAGPAVDYLSKSGDEAVFRDALIKQIEKYPDVGMWFAIACGAFAHGLHNTKGQHFKGDTSTMISMYGPRNVGKSTIFKQCQSIMTYPENSVQFLSKTSDRGLELIAENSNHSFFIIDEIQNHMAKKKGIDGVSHLMDLLNGSGRTVSSDGGKKVRRTSKYDNLIFSTSNLAVARFIETKLESGQGEFASALESRMIELNAEYWSAYPIFNMETHPMEREQVKGDIMAFDAVLQNNHGHLYDRVISYYSVNRDEVYDKLKRISTNLRNEYNLSFTNDLSRKGHFFAYSEVGIDAFCSQLNLPKNVEDKIRTRWLQLVAYLSQQGAQDTTSKKQNVLNELLSWVKSHQDKFGIRASGRKSEFYAWPNNKAVASAAEQKAFAQYINSNVKNELGVFEQDEPLEAEGMWTGDFWLTSTGYKTMEDDKVMIKEIVAEALTNGFLDATYKNGEFDRLQKRTASHGNVYKFKIGAYLKAMAEQEKKDEEERKKIAEIELSVSAPVSPEDRASPDEDWSAVLED